MIERGFVRGAVVQRKGAGAPEEVRARYVVVADGANSRFGRALGTSRDREWPYGTAIRGYWASPLHVASRGSSRASTCRTATATRCPATAGSSRSATAR